MPITIKMDHYNGYCFNSNPRGGRPTSVHVTGAHDGYDIPADLACVKEMTGDRVLIGATMLLRYYQGQLIDFHFVSDPSQVCALWRISAVESALIEHTGPTLRMIEEARNGPGRSNTSFLLNIRLGAVPLLSEIFRVSREFPLIPEASWGACPTLCNLVAVQAMRLRNSTSDVEIRSYLECPV